MRGYLDPDIEPNKEALDGPDRSTSFCIGQFAMAVVLVIFIFAFIAMIGFYFYLRSLPGH